MLNLSRKTLLAIEAVLDVALYAQPDPVQSKDIFRRQCVPHRHLEQVMQQLVRQEILHGVRGPKGGYVLARERRRITVGDIVRAIDAMDAGKDEDEATSPLHERIVAPFWEAREAKFLGTLDAVTIETLWQEARGKGLAASEETRDFTI